MWCVYFSTGGFIVQDPSNMVRLFQLRWVHCAGPSLSGASISAQVGSLCRTLLKWCVYFSIGGFIVQDPPHVVRLFQHRWAHCTGPSSCGASISAQVGSFVQDPSYVVRLFQLIVGSLCRTLLMWCVYLSIGVSNYINREWFVLVQHYNTEGSLIEQFINLFFSVTE